MHMACGGAEMRHSVSHVISELTNFRSGNKLPTTDLLIYLARPNSDAYITTENAEIPEDQYDWGYVLPAALFTDLGEGLFFTAGGVPIVVLASEIMADVGTNASHVLFKSISGDQQTGKLAIYDPAVDAAILIKAKKVLGIS